MGKEITKETVWDDDSLWMKAEKVLLKDGTDWKVGLTNCSNHLEHYIGRDVKGRTCICFADDVDTTVIDRRPITDDEFYELVLLLTEFMNEFHFRWDFGVDTFQRRIFIIDSIDEVFEHSRKKAAEARYWKSEFECLENKNTNQTDTDSDSLSMTENVVESLEQCDNIETCYKIAIAASMRVMDIAGRDEMYGDALLDKDDPNGRVVVEARRGNRITHHANTYGLVTPKQTAFRKYIVSLMELYRKTGSLAGMSAIRDKFGMTGVTKEQFLKYRLNDADYVSEQGGLIYFDKIYEEIKKRQ